MNEQIKKFSVNVQGRCRKSFDVEAATQADAEQIALNLFRATTISDMTRADCEADAESL